MINRVNAIILTIAYFLILGGGLLGQDCRFATGNDDSLSAALESFHDVMREMVHGPAEQGNFDSARARAAELPALRDAVMSARLPDKLSKRCPEISERAEEFSDAVDGLLARSRSGEDEAVGSALDEVHNAYRNLNNSLTTLGDLLDSFHEILHTLWHEAYPAKDAASVRTALPRLKVRARLIVASAERYENERLSGAQSLLDKVTLMEESAAADDDAALLDALRIMHDAFEDLAQGH